MVDSGPIPNVTACKVKSDCAWGEIDREILTAADCKCLMGCPHIPFNKATIERRRGQYDRLCDPRKNGKGDPCPVDDCAPPDEIDCVAGTCRTPIPDAGHD
ncbi:MAG: hypothetical protein U0270_41975 [Labilithrix sp.]